MPANLGRYETLRPIAAGGMAMVHLGRALGAGGFERLVAIKVLHPHIQAEPEFVSMFLDEARLAARIRHPNVVATIDVSESPLFLVMDYVEGPSLHGVQRELKKKAEAVPLGVSLRVVLDVLAGLDAAHELMDGDGRSLELVHRDVTPHNVLLGADGITRITDFGVARAQSRLSSTQGGQVKGKLAYMAPEQIRAASIDRRTDVYAAGVVLHELLANEMLFAADNEAALVVQVALGADHSPRSRNPDVPQAIDEVCMRALAASPEDRFPTASAFAEALEEAARGAGARPATAKEVAGFVKLLAVHEPAGSIPGSGSKPKPVGASSDPARAISQPTTLPAPQSSSSPTGMSSAFVPLSSRSRRPWLPVALTLAGAALLGLIGWLAFREATPPGSTSAATTAAAAMSTSAAALPSPSVAVTPMLTGAPSNVTTSVTAKGPSRSAMPPPKTPPTATQGEPRATSTPTPPVTSAATTPPTAFRPSGL